MQYLTTVEIAKKWNISLGRVLRLLREGRIIGAKQFSNRWMIPEDANKPIDNRTKGGKTIIHNKDDFRFFLYSLKDDDSFNPPLIAEELIIRKAFKYTVACQFDNTLNVLDMLPIESKNKYIRIYALYCSCIICFINTKTYKFFDYYSRLTLELQANFPYKKEVSMFLTELDAILGQTSQIDEKLSFDLAEKIHPECLPHYAAFMALSCFYSNNSNITLQIIQTLELNCAFIENMEGEEVDLQTIHFYLGVMNDMLDNKEAKEYHFQRVFELAEKYNLYWLVSMQYNFLGASFESVLQKCSSDFIDKIHKYSSEIQSRRTSFMNKSSKYNIFDLLPKKKYLYVYYAMRGFLNKEIAKLMNVSEKNVEKTFSTIYETLGVSSKKELIEYIKNEGQLVY